MTDRPGKVRHGTAARRGKPVPAWHRPRTGAGNRFRRGTVHGRARETGSGGATVHGRARDSGRDRLEDFGPDPLGAAGSRETADFLAAPPPSSSILTPEPPKQARTARPANVGTETIAAELAG